MTNPRSSTDTLTRPDKTSDSTIAPGAAGRRIWTLIVACLGVALVVGSMVALNIALSDIVVATSATQTELNWIVDGYTLALACLLLPAGAIGDRATGDGAHSLSGWRSSRSHRSRRSSSTAPCRSSLREHWPAPAPRS